MCSYVNNDTIFKLWVYMYLACVFMTLQCIGTFQLPQTNTDAMICMRMCVRNDIE